MFWFSTGCPSFRVTNFGGSRKQLVSCDWYWFLLRMQFQFTGLKGTEVPPYFSRFFCPHLMAYRNLRVIWKWEDKYGRRDSSIPPNVKLPPWMPLHKNYWVTLKFVYSSPTEDLIANRRPSITTFHLSLCQCLPTGRSMPKKLTIKSQSQIQFPLTYLLKRDLKM